MHEKDKAILRRLAASHVEQRRTEEARSSRYWHVQAGWVTTANGAGCGTNFGHRWALITRLGGDAAPAELRLERYSWGSSFREDVPAWAASTAAEALACEVAS